ncbi:protein of unknown function [Burkholderia multivorans]
MAPFLAQLVIFWPTPFFKSVLDSLSKMLQDNEQDDLALLDATWID